MPAGSPTIWVVPLSKIVAVLFTTGAPFTEMLLNDASQKLYLTEGVSALATNRCFFGPSQTSLVKDTHVKSPVKSALFVPPRKSSEPDGANFKPKTCEVTTPSEMRVWNTGGALNFDMD
jgi:hypothetical protein